MHRCIGNAGRSSLWLIVPLCASCGGPTGLVHGGRVEHSRQRRHRLLTPAPPPGEARSGSRNAPQTPLWPCCGSRLCCACRAVVAGPVRALLQRLRCFGWAQEGQLLGLQSAGTEAPHPLAVLQDPRDPCTTPVAPGALAGAMRASMGPAGALRTPGVLELQLQLLNPCHLMCAPCDADRPVRQRSAEASW